jgi:GNAT superfamily N-acetyltransferase
MSADDARARFAAATRHLLAPLPHGVVVQPCTPEEWEAQVEVMWQDLARPAVDLGPLSTPEQQAAIADLDAALPAALVHTVLFVHDDVTIGGYRGKQEAFGRYHMYNTILRPEWRGRGLYKAFLPHVEASVAESGFREMTSRHRADNNAVIVPKLRAGWLIAGFEVAPRFGLLVHLRRYLHDGFARAFAHRIDGAHAEELRAAGVKIP